MESRCWVELKSRCRNFVEVPRDLGGQLEQTLGCLFVSPFCSFAIPTTTIAIPTTIPLVFLTFFCPPVVQFCVPLGSSFAGLLFLFLSISILQFLLAICSFILLDIVREIKCSSFLSPSRGFEAHEGQKLQKWPVFSSSSIVHCISWSLNLQGFGCLRPPFRWKFCLDFDLVRFCSSAATCSDLLCCAYRLYLFFPLSPTFFLFCCLRLSILLDPAILTPGSCSGHAVVCKVDFRTAYLTAYLILWTLAVRGRTLQAQSFTLLYVDFAPTVLAWNCAK